MTLLLLIVLWLVVGAIIGFMFGGAIKWSEK